MCSVVNKSILKQKIKQEYIVRSSISMSIEEELFLEFIVNRYLNQFLLFKYVNSKSLCLEKGVSIGFDEFLSVNLTTLPLDSRQSTYSLSQINNNIIYNGTRPILNLYNINSKFPIDVRKMNFLSELCHYSNSFNYSIHPPKFYSSIEQNDCFTSFSVGVLKAEQFHSVDNVVEGDMVCIAELDEDRMPELDKYDRMCIIHNLMKDLLSKEYVKYIHYSGDVKYDIQDLFYKCFLHNKGVSVNNYIESNNEKVICVIPVELKDPIMSYFYGIGFSVTTIGNITDSANLQYRDSLMDFNVDGELLSSMVIEQAKGYKALGYDINQSIEKIKLRNLTSCVDKYCNQELAKLVVNHPNVVNSFKKHCQLDWMSNLDDVYQLNESTSHAVMYKYSKMFVSVVENSISPSAYNSTERMTIMFVNAVRRIVCSGGDPLSVAVNYSNASDYYEIQNMKKIEELCRFFCTKVSSFERIDNNESDVDMNVGVAGIVANSDYFTSLDFSTKGDLIFLIGKCKGDIKGSVLNEFSGYTDIYKAVEIHDELELHKVVKTIIHEKLIESANVIETGGLFTTLLHSCFKYKLGYDITTATEICSNLFLFSEDPTRIIVTVSPKNEIAFIDYMMDQKISFHTLGHVTTGEIRVDDESFGFISDYYKQLKNSA